MWLYFPATPEANDIALELTANFNGQIGAFYVNTSDGTKLSVGTYGNLAGYNVAAVTRPANLEWHYFIFVTDIYTTFAPAIYMDGNALSVSKTTETAADANVMASSTLYLLSRGNASLYSGAYIQQLGIWNKKLTEAEAIALSANTTQFLIPA